MSFFSVKHHLILSSLILTVSLPLFSAPRIPLELQNTGLVYCANQENFTLNPAPQISSIATDTLYNHLFNTIDGKNFDSELAHSFEFKNNGLTLIIHLRKNVIFHRTVWFNGFDEFDADDAIFSLKHFWGLPTEVPAFDKAFNSPYKNSNIKSITKINEHSIQIDLNQADFEILNQLANRNAIMLSLRYAKLLQTKQRLSNFYLQPVGTGIYKLDSYVKHQYLRLVKNDHYWGNPAKIKFMIVDLASNFEGSILKFLNNECQIVNAPDLSQLKILKDVKYNFNIAQSHSMSLMYLGFNNYKNNLKDNKVRMAISNAINRKRIIEQLYYGRANIVKDFLPSISSLDLKLNLTEINNNFYQYLPKQAKAVLAPLHLKLNLWVVKDRSFYNAEPVNLALIVKYDLEQAGIQVNVEYVTSNYLNKNINGKDRHSYDLVLSGINTDNTNPMLFFKTLFNYSDNPEETYTNWENSTFNSIMAKASYLNNQEKQSHLVGEAQQILFNELPILPLFSADRVFVLSPRIKKFSLNKIGNLSFSSLELKEIHPNLKPINRPVLNSTKKTGVKGD